MYGNPYNYLSFDASEVVDLVKNRSRYGSISTDSDESQNRIPRVIGMVRGEDKRWWWLGATSFCIIGIFCTVIFLVSRHRFSPIDMETSIVAENPSSGHGKPYVAQGSRLRNEEVGVNSDLSNRGRDDMNLLEFAVDGNHAKMIPKSWINCGKPGHVNLSCCLNVLCGAELALTVRNKTLKAEIAASACYKTWNAVHCSSLVNVGIPVMDCLACNSCIGRPDGWVCENSDTIDFSHFG